MGETFCIPNSFPISQKITSPTHPSGQAEQFAAAPKENSVGEPSPHSFSVPSPGQKNPVLHPRHLGFVVEFRAEFRAKCKKKCFKTSVGTGIS